MRDPLFERRNDYFAHRRALGEAARAHIEELPDPDGVVRGLTAWCRDALRQRDADTPAPTIPLLDFLSGYGTSALPTSIKEGFAALFADADHPRKHLSAWLLGQALADLLVDELTAGNTPRPLLPPDLSGAPSSADLTHASFHECLRRRLPDARAARARLLAFLREQIELIADEPSSGIVSSERDRFAAFVRDWESNRALNALWDSPGDHFFVLYHALDLVPTLMSVERHAVLATMDRFRFPHPIDQVLTSPTILHDRDEISAALEAAPLCKDDSQAWNGSHLAPLLLRTAEEHARKLWEAAGRSEDAAAVRDEIKARLAVWFEELAGVILRRPDGEFLASQWALAKLVDERRSRRPALTEHQAEHADRFLPQITLIDWIFKALSAAGLTSGAIAADIEFPAVPTRTQVSPARPSPAADEAANPFLRALCAIDLVANAQDTPDADYVASLLDHLDALLLRRDPAFDIEFSLATNTHDLPASRCGSLIARSPDAIGRWLRSWNALAEQRRRAQHWLQTDDADAVTPSMFLLASGISALDWMLSVPDRRHSNADEFWRLLFNAARECWLTISLTHLVERIEVQIARLFARHPGVFGNPPEDAVDDSGQTSANEGHYAALLAEDLALLGGGRRHGRPLLRKRSAQRRPSGDHGCGSTPRLGPCRFEPPPVCSLAGT